MAISVTDTSELYITVNDGWRTWVIPKFRLWTEVSGDFVTLYWVEHEKGGSVRTLSLDYNDVTGAVSAAGLQATIDGYIISAWAGGGGGGTVTGGLQITGVNYSLTPATITIVQCNTGGIAITLPLATSFQSGVIYLIKDASRSAGSSNIQVNVQGGDQFEGLSAGQALLIADDGKAVQFYSDLINTFYFAT